MDHYQNESFESFTATPAKPSTNNSKKTREYFRGLRNQAYAQPSFLQNKSPTQKNHTELEIYLAEPVDEENDDPMKLKERNKQEQRFSSLSKFKDAFLELTIFISETLYNHEFMDNIQPGSFFDEPNIYL
ncbi:19131_t:CDS:2 [Dentiscutata erythropus]|uniref:19131_t:CDS:1 n=1 Tax=Dentiscutata erythropus TaxID=1348616 RepID=A0A9N9ALQ1_9GLOM|nr:19131_t:CDS:2 [Dentiscutata erythropus]